MTPAFIAPALSTAFPLIFMAGMSLMLLLLGVARKGEDFRTVNNFAIFSFLAVAAVVARFSEEPMEGFNGLFVTDGFAALMQIMVLVGAAVALLMAPQYVERERMMRFEYPVLVMFSTLGMMVMITSNDLMTLYLGLELQSLPLYVLAAMQRDTVKSTEAGIKYFILGALSSGMLLYGASLLYGFAGTTSFNGLQMALTAEAGATPGVVVGMVLLLSGIAFKIAAAPFHMWVPDVYEGSPTSVTAFFALVPKIAALALLVRLLNVPFENIVDQWRQIIVALAVLSMAVGAVGAIAQSNIKRLLAYSSIGHMGYALLGLAAANAEGVRAVIIYALLYMVMTAGAFAVVLLMKRKDRMVEKVADLAGLARSQPLLAAAMTIIMFSMAGIPPLAGFFSKLFVFQAVIDAQLYALAVFGVVASVISAYYYLRVIKVMYFDEAADEALDRADDAALTGVLTFSTAVLVLFIVLPGSVISWAREAAAALIQ
jgi:NADH-quinone oxidoreductase subunit N